MNVINKIIRMIYECSANGLLLLLRLGKITTSGVKYLNIIQKYGKKK